MNSSDALRPPFRRRYAIGLLALVVAACAPGDSPTEPLSAPSAMWFTDGPGTVTVCKMTAQPTDDLFDFATSASGGLVVKSAFTLHDIQPGATIQASDCVLVWVSTDDSQVPVTITEDLEEGWSLAGAYVKDVGPVPFSGNSVTVTGANHVTITLVVVNQPTPDEPMAPGRMTGGGNQITVGGAKITRGFTIHCDITLSNNIEVNWKSNKWHLDKPITSATCIDDPNVEPAPPPAPFDTFIGEGVGRLNGVDGSFIRFTFVDAGEPGGDNDHAIIRIWAPGANPAVDAPVLDVNGFLSGGNLQAHYDQPHK
jgi:hypothetical protein